MGRIIKNCSMKRVVKLALLFAFLIPLSSLAQNIQLTGTVTDTTGETVIGASVLEKGTTNGVITNIDGNFSLNVSPKAIIVISYVGYTTQEIPLNGAKNIKVVLREDTEMLEEVVVIGYGTMKKSDMTGAISSVDVEELSKRTTTNPAEALQGKIAGVNIMKAGGNAGAGVQVKIRGVKTFGDNEPLYIIDGFPGDINAVNPQDIQAMEVLKDGAAAAIYGSVAANGVIIVTTKNGKKGETKIDFSAYVSMTNVAKKLDLLNAEQYKKVHTQMYENWNAHVINHKSQCDPKGNGAWEKQILELEPYMTKNTGIDTDWQDAMMRTGLSQNYMFSVRGGSENAQYSVSYNHADDKGIFLGNDYRQDNARLKLHMSKYIFDIDANMAFKFTDSKQPEYQLKEMYMISPLVPIYNENEEYGFGLTNFDNLPNNRNVMADQHYEKSTDKKYHTTANVALTANFTKWLSFKISYAYRGEHQRQTYHTPAYISDVKAKRDYPYHSETTAYWEEHVWENVLSFNKAFGKHSVNAVAGTSTMARKYTWNSVGVEGKSTTYKVEDGQLVIGEQPGGFLDPGFSTIGAGAGGTYDGDGTKWDYRRVSFFGRVNYNYNDRYLIQATVRSDGSSKFGADNRWGFFPSIAVGWRISEEEFFPKGIALNNLKLRASWGRLGNENALGYYDFLALISTYNTKYQGYVKGNGDNAWAGSIARGLENRSLKWETTDTKNIGLDFGFFNQRLTISPEFYINRSSNLLLNAKLPTSSGYNSMVINAGETENKGIDLTINSTNITNKNFTWNTSITLSHNKNSVKKLTGEDVQLWEANFGYSQNTHIIGVNQPLGQMYGYVTDGLYQVSDFDYDAATKTYTLKDGVPYAGEKGNVKPGMWKFKNIDGSKDNKITEADKTVIGNAYPKIYGGINNTFTYKDFDLSIFLTYSIGNDVFNATKLTNTKTALQNKNVLAVADSKHRWVLVNKAGDLITDPQEMADINKGKTVAAIYDNEAGDTYIHSWAVEDGSFLKLSNITLGYTFPKKMIRKVGLSKLRLYATGSNLLTWTKYSGFDPEVSTMGNGLTPGVDFGAYPRSRAFVFGINLAF